jgi:hypothetical protein
MYVFDVKRGVNLLSVYEVEAMGISLMTEWEREWALVYVSV